MIPRFLGPPVAKVGQEGLHAGPRVTRPVLQLRPLRYLARYGAAPISGPQGNLQVTPAVYRGLQTQTLWPAPVRLFRALAGRQPRTVQANSVPIQTKPLGVPAFRMGNLKPYGGPPPTPLMLGSSKQIGRDTIRRPVYPPPQGLIPSIMQKLFKRGGS